MLRLRSLACVTAALALAACDADRPLSPARALPDDASLWNGADPSDPTPSTITLEKIGGFDHGGETAAEIVAYDAVSKRLFVVNAQLGTVDVLDFRSPSSPVKIATLSIGQFGASANSVAIDHGVVAVAIEAHVKTMPGTVAFYRATTLEVIASVQVGALPDMLTFTPDGKHVLVANEGEPSDDYLTDPEGTVSIIDVSNVNRPTVRTVGFTSFNGQAASLRAAGVRIFGPGASVAQDLEPEYVAVSEDGRTAWVALQENNALAVVDIASATAMQIVPLGFKDHNRAGSGLDASDRDGPGNTGLWNVRPWPVLGMYQPDGIAAYTAGGATYLVTANEGDARDYDGFAEEQRVGANLNAAIFTSALCSTSCSGNTGLARLTATNTLGFNVTTGKFDAVYAFGARSFSIRTASGQLVWDSGDDFEQRTKTLPMVSFNASNDDNTLDSRSDNKGPEPEGVVLGRLGAKTFAFIGLERAGGVMVYDVTNPTAPQYVTYANSRAGGSGDRGPEGLAFIPAVRSPNRHPLLVVGNETSGTTTVFRINLF